MTEARPLEHESPLYCCYNGMMMGFFLGCAHACVVASRYPALRNRAREFLGELGVSSQLPEEHAQYVEGREEHLSAALEKLSRRSPEIAAFTLLASSAMEWVIRGGLKTEDEWSVKMKTMALGFLEERGLPSEALDRFAEGVETSVEGLSMNALHTSALTFLKEVLDPLDQEPQTAFVVMPFSDRFDSNFVKLYKPLLERFDYRALRAWGGFANEGYYELLLTLIEKSGAVLVELSEPNLNVMYELGFADAREVPVLVLLEEGAPRPPSNLSGRFLASYTRGEKEGWEEEAIEEASFGFAIYNASLERQRLETEGAEPDP